MIDANDRQRKPAIVSICGPSNAGKSQLAKASAAVAGETIASRVPTDYFLLPRTGDGQLAWDWDLLKHRLALPQGTVTSTPDLDFETLRRRSDLGGLPFTIRPVLLCDVMAPCPGSDLVVLIDVPAHVRRARVVERDGRWGTTVADRWEELETTWSVVSGCVRPDIRLDGTRPVDELATIVAGEIRRRLGHTER